jgi:hypothetical protein
MMTMFIIIHKPHLSVHTYTKRMEAEKNMDPSATLPLTRPHTDDYMFRQNGPNIYVQLEYPFIYRR